MSASLLDLVSQNSIADDLVSLAGWLEEKGSEREAGKVRDLADDIARVRRAARTGTTAAVLAVIRSQIGEGGLDASATRPRPVEPRCRVGPRRRPRRPGRAGRAGEPIRQRFPRLAGRAAERPRPIPVASRWPRSTP